jgi:hypothetical protein
MSSWSALSGALGISDAFGCHVDPPKYIGVARHTHQSAGSWPQCPPGFLGCNGIVGNEDFRNRRLIFRWRFPAVSQASGWSMISRAQPHQEEGSPESPSRPGHLRPGPGRDRGSDAARRFPITRAVGAVDLDSAQETHRAVGYRSSLKHRISCGDTGASPSRVHGEVATCHITGAVPVADRCPASADNVTH